MTPTAPDPVPDPVPDSDEVDELLETLLGETRTEVGHADHKASLVLAALGIGFSAFLGGLYASSWEPNDLPGWGPGIWYAGAGAALLSVIAAGFAVFPRTGKTDHGPDRPIYYWGQISKIDSKEAFEQALQTHPPDAEQRTIDQLYVLSKVVSEKYCWVKCSLWLAVAAIALLITAGIIELAIDDDDSSKAMAHYVIDHQ